MSAIVGIDDQPHEITIRAADAGHSLTVGSNQLHRFAGTAWTLANAAPFATPAT